MAKTSKTTETDRGRRDFLKFATTAAPVAVAAAALGGTQAAAATATAQPNQGVQDTAHTRAYYASARF
ncbi:MAG: twin-arginine translocation pathway signal protein [Paracoccaceae bacterium]|nr:twin-arginine translocation pathway signal protein [Paracoccaceae bacterium]